VAAVPSVSSVEAPCDGPSRLQEAEACLCDVVADENEAVFEVTDEIEAVDEFDVGVENNGEAEDNFEAVM
jgi:hypothetical protein